MASPNIWPSLSSLGPSFATLSGNYFTGTVRFVDSASGNDANSGLVPGSPKKTLSATVTAAGANDVILLATGFTETISATVTISVANLTIIGLGSGAGMASITNNAATGIAMSAAGARLYNLNFPAAVAAGLKISSNSTTGWIEGCTFSAGTLDTVCIQTAAGTGLTVKDCAFTVTASSGTNPINAIKYSGGTDAMKILGCTFDGASFGWNGYAVDTQTNVTAFEGRDIKLYNRSGFRIASTGGTYSIFGLRPGDSTSCPIVITA